MVRRGCGLALDRDYQSSNSPEVDPNPRIILDDLRERVVAVWAAEHDAGASVDVNGADRPGCTAAAAGPDRGCHLDGEHLLQETCDRVPVQHQLVHVSLPVGPKRSVLTARGSCPSRTSDSATASTNGAGPHAYKRGRWAGEGATSASISASTRRA